MESLQIIFSVIVCAVIYALLLYLITLLIKTGNKRRGMVIVFCTAASILLNYGGLLYNIFSQPIVSPWETGLNCFVSLVKAVYVTGRLFLFNDTFSMLGAVTGNIYFSCAYYALTSVIFIMYGITLFSLLSLRFSGTLKMFFRGKREIYVYTSLNENSLYFIKDIQKKDKRAVHCFLLNSIKKADIGGGLFRSAQKLGCLFFSVDDKAKNFNELAFFTRRGVRQNICFMVLADSCEENIGFMKKYYNYASDNAAKRTFEERFSFYVRIREGNYIEEKFDALSNVHLLDEYNMKASYLVNRFPISDCCCEAEKSVNAIQIGNGSTGQAMFFKALVAAQIEGYRFKGSIFDRGMNASKGLLLNEYPLLRDYDIDFYNCEAGGEEFFKNFKKALKPDNYIVIALADDMQSVRLANTLAKIVLKQMDKRARLIVHVRTEFAAEFIEEIGHGVEIYATGLKRDIYTREVIIDSCFDEAAKQVNAAYNRIYQTDTAWHSLSEEKRDSNRSVVECFPAKLKAIGCRAKKKADISSGDRIVRRVDLSKEEELILAQSEHSRWCAFHAVHGWDILTVEHLKKINEGNTGRYIKSLPGYLLHSCLIPFEELPKIGALCGEDVQASDYMQTDILFDHYDKNGYEVVRL